MQSGETMLKPVKPPRGILVTVTNGHYSQASNMISESNLSLALTGLALEAFLGRPRFLGRPGPRLAEAFTGSGVASGYKIVIIIFLSPK